MEKWRTGMRRWRKFLQAAHAVVRRWRWWRTADDMKRGRNLCRCSIQAGKLVEKTYNAGPVIGPFAEKTVLLCAATL